MLKGIIFDMDGVIIDSHPIHKKAWKKFLHSVGKDVSDQELEFVLDGRKREDILRHFLGDMTATQVLEYGDRKERLFREEALAITPMEGLPRFLDEVDSAGISMAIASSGSHSRVHFILDCLGMTKRFKAIITGDEVRCGKPDPEIFALAGQRLCAANHELLVIEDAVSGVLAAKTAGMRCVAIASNGRAEALLGAGAERAVPAFRDLSVAALREMFS